MTIILRPFTNLDEGSHRGYFPWDTYPPYCLSLDKGHILGQDLLAPVYKDQVVLKKHTLENLASGGCCSRRADCPRLHNMNGPLILAQTYCIRSILLFQVVFLS